ncbi:tetratricopeptide repeat protein [Marinobacter halophilus]|uniref:Sel1 repeat family protein n=1 Tax=Marinobacter halophilus TaxID=1323740 RepID=A0A2T1KF02_9GAMM|nr:SEL1-like repeat protein [Marinobacter halophilus]PSF08640.1 sel1 repeat family protein [Marinobacter halophilus]GGC62386.1 hypothetical protein GCM10011362_08580 [Marinobacter halophilus]
MRSLTLIFIIPLFASMASVKASDLSYEAYIDSDKRIKCLYGYAAEKTGNHAVAIRIFEDCIRRWNDVYSMIGLAQIYETGIGVQRDQAYATSLMKRGAELDDAADYSSLARYHYGKALYQGTGTDMNQAEGLHWLRRAAASGSADAQRFLHQIETDPSTGKPEAQP